LRTLSDSTETEGQQLQVHIEQQAIKILEESDFCPIDGTPPDELLDSFEKRKTVTQSSISVKKAIENCCQQVPKLKDAIH